MSWEAQDRNRPCPQIARLFVDGRTLRDQFEAGQRLGFREAAQTISKVAEALHYAHRNGAVHRDVNPDYSPNLFLGGVLS